MDRQKTKPGGLAGKVTHRKTELETVEDKQGRAIWEGHSERETETEKLVGSIVGEI